MDADYFRQLAMADPDTWTSDDFLDAADVIEQLTRQLAEAPAPLDWG